MILNIFIRAKSNTCYWTGEVCCFFPTSFLALTPAKVHLNHSSENQLHVSKAEQSSNLSPVLIQSLFCFKLPTHSLFPAAEPHNVQRPHTRCKSNRGLLKIKVQQLSRKDRLQRCCLENRGKEWGRKGRRRPWEIHTESDGNLHWSIFYRNPLPSAHRSTETRRFPYENRQDAAQKKEVVLSRGKRWYCGPRVCSQLCCWLAKRTWSQWKKTLCPLFPPFEEVSGSIRASYECCAVSHRPWQTAKLSKSSGFFSPVLMLKGPFSEKHSLGCHIVASLIPLHPIIRARYH